MILFANIDLTGKNTVLKWFKKIPGGIGILSNGTHSVKIKCKEDH